VSSSSLSRFARGFLGLSKTARRRRSALRGSAIQLVLDGHGGFFESRDAKLDVIAHTQLDQTIGRRHAYALVQVELFDHHRVLEHQLFVRGDDLPGTLVGAAGQELQRSTVMRGMPQQPLDDSWLLAYKLASEAITLRAGPHRAHRSRSAAVACPACARRSDFSACAGGAALPVLGAGCHPERPHADRQRIAVPRRGEALGERRPHAASSYRRRS